LLHLFAHLSPSLKVAWISYFPIERLPDLPEPLRDLPREHPASWQRVLLEEFIHDKSPSAIQLHVIVVRGAFKSDCTFDWNGVRFHCLKVRKRAMSLYWRETFRIRRCLKEIQPELVHAWGSERGAALVASRLGYPYLVTMQGLLEWYLQHVSLNIHHRLDALLEKPGLRRASTVTTECKFAVNWLGERYPHLEVRQVEHAPNWIFHRLRREPQLKPIRFLFVGVLSEVKGTDLLLQALDRLRHELDFTAHLIGTASPDYLRQLRELTSPAVWERIHLRDGLTADEVAEEMSKATILLFPTRADTSPNSVKEAAVAGLPVVASAIGGIVDYIVPGQNGVTFPAGNLEAFVEAIRAAASHPLFSRGEVNPQTLKEMRNYLSPLEMRDRFYEAYRRVLEKGLRRSG